MTDPAIGYQRASDIFEMASSRANQTMTERSYSLGGRLIRLRVLGDALAAELHLPIQQLEVSAAPTSTPALEIDVWDGAIKGMDAYVGELDQEAGTYGQVTLSEDGRFCGEQRGHSALWFDRTQERIVGCFSNLKTRDLDERARPFHRYFAVWLAVHDIQGIHAGLVSIDGKGLLFVGSGGTGKTTSSISSFLGGIGYLGDDFVGIEELGDGQFTGHCLYSSCLVNNDHIKRFPALEAVCKPPHHAHEEKSIVYLAPLGPDQIKTQTPVSGIVMPRIMGKGETTFRPARKAEALLRMAPSSIMSLPIVVDGALDRLASLVDAVPCYWLELGTDIDNIPTVVREVFDSLAAPSETAAQ
ncbi:MAG: hypothetical protein ACE363_03905 [Alphaproteobacteria bacterium]